MTDDPGPAADDRQPAAAAAAPAATAAPYPGARAFWIAVAAWLVLDQGSKLAVEAAGRALAATVVPGLVNLKYVENHGGAWGLFSGASESFRMPFFVVTSIAAIGFLFYLRTRMRLRRRWTGWAFPAVLGGALGNLVDRVRLGYVIDFLDFHAGSAHWPTFNVADIGITVGVGMLLLDSLMPERRA